MITLSFQNTIRPTAHCLNRQDDWGTTVLARLSAINDLPAEKALYHHICKNYFTDGKDIPSFTPDEHRESKRKKNGRPKCTSKLSAFKYAIEYLKQNDDETVTLHDLHMVMMTKSCLKEKEVYTTNWLKDELKRYYGPKVSITSDGHAPNIVTLTSNAMSLINEAHENALKVKELSDMDKLIQCVGEYIRSEIKSMEKHGDVHPTSEEMSSFNSKYCIPTSIIVPTS